MTLKRLSTMAIGLGVFAVACADSTAPNSKGLGVQAPLLAQNYFVVGAAIPTGTAYGDVWLCKEVSTGDPSNNPFAFTVTSTAEDGITGIAPNDGAGVATSPTDASPDFLSVAPGDTDCLLIYDSAAGQGFGSVDRLLITEAAQANWAVASITVEQYVYNAAQVTTMLTSNALDFDVNTTNRTATVRGNSEAVTVVTYVNDFTPPGDPGCTLTQGYWQNHLAWPNIPALDPNDTPTSLFLGSGKTFLQIMTTEPNGNAYYIFGKQVIAALLNQANGASSTPAVDAAIDYALNHADGLAAWGSADSGPSNPVRATWISLALLLDEYNRGLTGPGKCRG